MSVGLRGCTGSMFYLSDGKELPVVAEAHTCGRLDLLLHGPGLVGGGICAFSGGWRGERRHAEACIAQRRGCAIATLVLGGGRGSSID